jgi:hypothetical protein
MYTVKQTGSTWAVFQNGEKIEGGFFTRPSAVERAATLARPARYRFVGTAANSKPQ